MMTSVFYPTSDGFVVSVSGTYAAARAGTDYKWYSHNDKKLFIQQYLGGDTRGMQLWAESGGGSSNLTFRNVTLNSVGSNKYCVAVCSYFSDVLFEDCVMTADPSGEAVIMWYGGTQIVFDGITASGGAVLHKRGDNPDAVSCEIKNGTYTGSTLGSVTGVTLTNITRLD